MDIRHYGRYGYVEYADVPGYAEQAREAVETIDALVDTGHADDAMYLAREAVDALAEAYGSIDDSSGYVGGVAHELAAVHARACLAARPDPRELADYLAGKLLASDDVVEFDLADYTEALGADGLGRVRERISDAWAKNPSGWLEKYLMESLEWAERGLREARQPDVRLVDYVATRYQADGRAADVVDLRRNYFATDRSLGSYRQLREAAEHAGVWQVERPPALKALRADATSRSAHRFGWGGPVWIEALLDDGDIEAAWQAAPGVASDQQWLRVADAIAPTRPADALAVYLRLIEPLKSQAGDAIYQQVARLLLSARLLATAGSHGGMPGVRQRAARRPEA
ncbi:MAG TPA: hypothetical protein VFX60_16860 [Micromonospora sp.]|nr:hypothetical protein [Micromonospora sp.]